MNGRVYDPTLGRFLQADPFIQAAKNSQSHNRYSYVLNNPMSMTDPSGYFSLSKFLAPLLRPLIRASSKIFGSTLTNIAGNILFYKLGGPIGSAYWSYNFTRAMGGTSSGALRAGIISGISAQIFQQIGSEFTGAAEGSIKHIAAHAIAGGIIAELQGGKFGHGFFSAGLTKALNVNDIIGTSQAAGMDIVRIVTAAVIGGTISKVTGGKFANGATTAAFAQAFNGNGSAEYEEALAELQKNVHEDAAFRADQITELAREENWDEIRKLYPHLANTSDNKMFLEALNLNQEFSRIVSETVIGKVGYELDSKIGKPAKAAIEIFVAKKPMTVVDALFGWAYSPYLPVEHQFVYGRETITYEYIRREYE